VAFHAMHPGWVATPGLERSLPVFARLMGPVLRTPAEGADTIVWLATAEQALLSSGDFWLDRRRRSIHRTRRTREPPGEEARLWDQVTAWASDASTEPTPREGEAR
jgi:hypothetical protein